jgi:hypothetical protein
VTEKMMSNMKCAEYCLFVPAVAAHIAYVHNVTEVLV